MVIYHTNIINGNVRLFVTFLRDNYLIDHREYTKS